MKTQKAGLAILRKAVVSLFNLKDALKLRTLTTERQRHLFPRMVYFLLLSTFK